MTRPSAQAFRHDAIVIYDDSPSVLTDFSHVLRARPIRGGDRAVNNAVVVLRVRVVYAFGRWGQVQIGHL
jgi:hypothetical protein